MLTDNVQISSVIPRLDQNNEKVDLLNAGLISLCEEAGVKYIDNRPGFTTQDGEVNDGYLENDGIHLSRAGTNKLVKNLKLKMKSSDVYCQSATPHKRRDTKHQQGHHVSKKNPLTTNDAWKRKNSGLKPRRFEPQRDRHQKYAENWATSGSQPGSYFDMDREQRCYFCYEIGHKSSTCRHGGPVTCHSCFCTGHKQKHCTR